MEDITTVMDSTNHMFQLIEDILQLSKVGRVEFDWQLIDVSILAEQIIHKLKMAQPERLIQFVCEKNLQVKADGHLMEILMYNLLQNAWKYTTKTTQPIIEFGSMRDQEKVIYFVRDNGAGFDVSKAENLFKKIGRYHTSSEFEGTGVGLTIVNRIVQRHSGEIWAESEIGKGTTIFFTLGNVI